MPWFSVGEWISLGSDRCGLCCSHGAGHFSCTPRKSGLLDPSSSIWTGTILAAGPNPSSNRRVVYLLVRSLIHASAMVLAVRLPLACFLVQADLNGMSKNRADTKNREALAAPNRHQLVGPSPHSEQAPCALRSSQGRQACIGWIQPFFERASWPVRLPLCWGQKPSSS